MRIVARQRTENHRLVTFFVAAAEVLDQLNLLAAPQNSCRRRVSRYPKWVY
ncbi:MAG: hypothetical protein ACJAQ6_000990 [Arenicella sp.]|jgi:hypothetical protein